MRSLALRVVSAAACLGAGACGSNRSDVPPELLDAIEKQGGSAGYPAGPYGKDPGDTIGDLCFDGWRNPSAGSYDEARLDRICLHEYRGDPEARLLLINSSALWCVACRYEYGGSSNRPGLGDRLAERQASGFRLLGTLFEGNDAEPATTADAATWARTYDVAFPFVVDDDHALGTSDIAPTNRVVDTTTMEVLLSIDGDEPAVLFSFIDDFLSGTK